MSQVVPPDPPAVPRRAAAPNRLLSDDSLDPEELRLRRTRRRGRWLALGLCAGLLAAGVFAARPVARGIKGWQARQLAAEAETLLAGPRWREADPKARAAVVLAFNEPAAVRAMAAFQSRAGTPEAVGWWARAVELEPARVENRLALAHAALQSEEPAYAARVLEEIPTAARATAAWQEAAARLALAQQRFPDAEKFFAEAVRLDPASSRLRVNLANARLAVVGPGRESVHAEARRELEELRARPDARRLALRSLLDDAARRRDPIAATRLADELRADPTAGFDDHYRCVTALADAGAPGMEQVLEDAVVAAGNEPSQQSLLAQWMIRHERANQALRFLRGLPEPARARMPLAWTMADALVAAQDWPALDRTLRAQDWGGSEFLRLAYLARAARGEGRAEATRGWWQKVLAAAGDDLAAQTLLARVTERWRWRPEEAALLWKIIERHPGERWVFPRLQELCVVSGDTRGLHRLCRLRLAEDPGNDLLRNDLTATALLLGDNLAEAHREAETLAARRPDDPFAASTLAYSLLLRGRAAEAMATLERLPEDDRMRPGVALYYGAALAAAGRIEAAQPWLARASVSPLFPEERALLDSARVSK